MRWFRKALVKKLADGVCLLNLDDETLSTRAAVFIHGHTCLCSFDATTCQVVPNILQLPFAHDELPDGNRLDADVDPGETAIEGLQGDVLPFPRQT